MSLALGLSFIPACHSSPQHPQPSDAPSNPTTQERATAFGASSAESTGNTLCNAGEQALFSCELPSLRRQVALCAQGSGISYRYGLPGHVEMTYPAPGETAEFHRNPVMLAGARGGYVYAFRVKGLIHAIASIGNTDDDGTASLNVFTVEGKRAVNAECDPASLHESDDERLLRTVHAWSRMQDLSADGSGVRIGP